MMYVRWILAIVALQMLFARYCPQSVQLRQIYTMEAIKARLAAEVRR